jgi:hypothetical protein
VRVAPLARPPHPIPLMTPHEAPSVGPSKPTIMGIITLTKQDPTYSDSARQGSVVEVTPSMRQIGGELLQELSSQGTASWDCLAELVYTAMVRAKT